MEAYNVVHLTGRGKLLDFESPHYKGFEFLQEGYADVVAAADLVICRAGANSIFELVSLHKPMLLIPLVVGSRGDQVDNARLFTELGWATTLQERELNTASLRQAIQQLFETSSQMQTAQQRYDGRGAAAKVTSELLSFVS